MVFSIELDFFLLTLVPHSSLWDVKFKIFIFFFQVENFLITGHFSYGCILLVLFPLNRTYI